ncbi:uncharacterized protein [Dermacentor albipictus]|uniref:uncharacterized protein n=1 Tax=Dermacentor albipictus TaxID=60249 RepID=UPI0038FC0690
MNEISQAGRGGISRILSSLSSVAGITDALRRMRPLHFTVLSVYGSAASPGARQLNPVRLVSVAAYIRPASPVLPCSQRQNLPVSLRRYFVSWQSLRLAGSAPWKTKTKVLCTDLQLLTLKLQGYTHICKLKVVYAGLLRHMLKLPASQSCNLLVCPACNINCDVPAEKKTEETRTGGGRERRDEDGYL